MLRGSGGGTLEEDFGSASLRKIARGCIARPHNACHETQFRVIFSLKAIPERAEERRQPMSDEPTNETVSASTSEPDQTVPPADVETSEVLSGKAEPQPTDENGNVIPAPDTVADPDAADPTSVETETSSDLTPTDTSDTSTSSDSASTSSEGDTPTSTDSAESTSTLPLEAADSETSSSTDSQPPTAETSPSETSSTEPASTTTADAEEEKPWDKVAINDMAARRAAGDPTVPPIDFKPGLTVVIGDASDVLHPDTISIEVGKSITITSPVGTIRVVAVDHTDS